MKFLFVVYDYSADALAASFRVRSFVKYLVEFGHEVTVLCARGSSDSIAGEKVVIYPFTNAKTILGRILRRLLIYPDPSALWSKRVRSKIARLNSIGGADVVVSSSPPHGIQQLALWISKEFGTPLVVDFRDDFITNHRVRWHTPLHRRAAAKLELSLVSHAELVLVNTDIVRHRFLDRYPGEARKIFTLENGYDETDFCQKIENNYSNSKEIVRIVYVGGDYGGFAPSFMQKIASLIEKFGALEYLEIHTAGPGDWTCHGKWKMWSHHGLLSAADATKLARRADVLILLMPPGEREPSGTVPLKTYQYLRTLRSIAYFGEHGSTTDLLAQFEGTHVYSREGIEDFVRDLSCQIYPSRVEYESRLTTVEKYNFQNITIRLLAAIDQVALGRLT